MTQNETSIQETSSQKIVNAIDTLTGRYRGHTPNHEAIKNLSTILGPTAEVQGCMLAYQAFDLNAVKEEMDRHKRQLDEMRQAVLNASKVDPARIDDGTMAERYAYSCLSPSAGDYAALAKLSETRSTLDGIVRRNPEVVIATEHYFQTLIWFGMASARYRIATEMQAKISFDIRSML